MAFLTQTIMKMIQNNCLIENRNYREYDTMVLNATFLFTGFGGCYVIDQILKRLRPSPIMVFNVLL